MTCLPLAGFQDHNQILETLVQVSIPVGQDDGA